MITTRELKRPGRPLRPDTPKGREAKANFDQVNKEVAEADDRRERKVGDELDNMVDKGFCQYYRGKRPGFFFAVRAPWLKTIIKGVAYTDEELAAI